MQIGIDHIVIGAADLSQGAAYVRDQLGVDMPYGGVHATMGTHNHLMRLGDHLFLEVIAVNPRGEPPNQPRWYGLDDPSVRQRIADQPSLLTWVVNTENIDRFIRQAKFSFGRPTLIRRGDFAWYFGLPEDGRLLAGGLLPYVIDWQTEHPAGKMANLGCQLKGLEIYHPYPGWIQSALTSIHAANLVLIRALPDHSTPYLLAHIQTPSGLRTLQSGI